MPGRAHRITARCLWLSVIGVGIVLPAARASCPEGCPPDVCISDAQTPITLRPQLGTYTTNATCEPPPDSGDWSPQEWAEWAVGQTIIAEDMDEVAVCPFTQLPDCSCELPLCVSVGPNVYDPNLALTWEFDGPAPNLRKAGTYTIKVTVVNNSPSSSDPEDCPYTADPPLVDYETIVVVIPAGGTDNDSDNVLDACDNCPLVANPGQQDADGDGFGDACDTCRWISNPDQADRDKDHIGDICDPCPDVYATELVDTDGDKVPDCADGCPADPNKIAPGQCGCGAAETDTDYDLISDCVDNCLTVANHDQLNTDQDTSGDACDDDDDNDGVLDPVDNCPLVQNVDQTDTDGDEVGDACDNCLSVPNHDQSDIDGNGLGDACDTTGSFAFFTAELGGNNHWGDYEMWVDYPPFAPGTTNDGRSFFAADALRWGVRVRAGGRHDAPEAPSHQKRVTGVACAVFDLELHQGWQDNTSPPDPLTRVPLVAGSATTPGWFSTINDGDADGGRGAALGPDLLANAAFATVFDIDGLRGKGGRVIDPRIAGGPHLSTAVYPFAAGRPAGTSVPSGVLAGMGAGYGLDDLASGSAGVAVTTAPASDCPALGDQTLFEGQINTSGLPAGSYTLFVIPRAANLLLTSGFCTGSHPGWRITPANHVSGDTIQFTLRGD